MEKLTTAFCERQGKSPLTVQFLFKGQPRYGESGFLPLRPLLEVDSLLGWMRSAC